MKEVRKRIFILLLAASLVFPMLSKPALAEEQAIINEAPDPDIAILQAAREAVENTAYPAAKQEEQGTEAAVKSYVEQQVKQAANNDAIDLAIHVDEYTAPKAGDADYPDGTDGEVAFTVTLTKGAQVQSTTRLTLAITAAPYSGVSNQQVLDEAKRLLLEEEHTIDVPLGTTWTEIATILVINYYTDLLVDFDLSYLFIMPKYPNPETQTTDVEITIEKGQLTERMTASLSINEERDPDLATAKTAAENADYRGITQAMYDNRSHLSFIQNRARAAIKNSGIVTDRLIVGSVKERGYVPSITGDAANPNGTDGSFSFTVTFYRAWQVWTTEQVTVPIVATSFREVNEQAMAAVKAALVDGEVDVAFGASQAVKTAAVQSYVDRLLAGDPKVTATVAYNSGTGGYDVALVRGNVSDSKSLTMTVKESADPDIAIVSAAKAAAEGASYSGTTQAAHGDEAAAKSYVENQARAAVNNSTVTVTVTKVSYIAPIAGDGDNLNGTDGSYAFTVTVAKGLQSQTTAQQTIVIAATAFNGVPNAQAVAAAKAALADGEVDVAFEPSQADKTAAVQSYVNGLLVGDAAGVTAIVTFNGVSGKYDVTLSKGSVNDSKSLSMTFNESADPDIAILQAAREAVENTAYPAAKQEEQGTEAAVKSYVEQQVKQAANNDAIDLAIHVDEYTAAKAGDADYPEGTDGQVAFTVTLTKGAQVQSTTRLTLAITATPYSGVSNQQVLDEAKRLLLEEEHTIDVPLGTTWTEIATIIVMNYYTDLLVDFDLSYLFVMPKYPNPETQTTDVDITIEKGQLTERMTASLSINEERDPDLATAKTAAENADYRGITQAMYDNRSHLSFIQNRARAAIKNSGIVTDRLIVGSVKERGYVPSITGDAANPNGTDGSFSFTVTFYRAWQVWTTEQVTVPIVATSFREVNEQAMAAVKAALVDGEVDVAFGASQAVKTAAVQSYVDRLLAGDPKVTATVAYNSGTGGYDVALVRGNVSDSKSLTMTVKESADPDIAIVSAAKAAAEGASYSGTTQAAHGDEAAAKSYVENQARAAVNNSAVTVTATKVSYIAPIAGDGDNLNGTDGSYAFTVTVAKGLQSQTTAQQTIVIAATAFNGVPNVQAVAAGKAAMVDGIVDVVFQPSQADKTAAVQSYVNSLLVGDAAGVTAIVTFNGVSGKYDVTLSKGSVNDSKSLSMTFNESADPDIAILQAAREAVENTAYPAAKQEEQGTEAAVKSYVEQQVKQAANNDAIDLAIHVDEYTAPKAGDADYPEGTDGQVAFTVTLTKGAQVQSTARLTLAITATPYSGVSNQQVLDEAKRLLLEEEHTIDVPLGTTWTEIATIIVMNYYTDLLVDFDLSYLFVMPKYPNPETQTTDVDITIEKGQLTERMTASLSINEERDPDLATAKTAAENADYRGITQAMYDNRSHLSFIQNRARAAIKNSGIVTDRLIVGSVKERGYVPSITGDAANPNGTDGSFSFTVTFYRAWQVWKTEQVTVPIQATPYDGLSNAQAVAAAKTALADGTIDVAFGASQADKTAAVQSYVNGLLIGDAAGVAATVAYNSVSGKYDVVLSKGSASDSKSLTMTVKESADPDIAIVAVAKTAAEGASYSGMTQAEAVNESVIAAALKATAEAAVNNNAVMVTVTKVSYIAPIAGDGDNLNGTDGSYAFTVTVAKGLQSQTTAQQTIVIAATAFNGVPNAQAVAAAKAALADGEVDVAFGASQADKTAAVQSYVNGLLVGDAAGVTAIVTFNSVSGKYDVTLSKGSVNDSKSLSMTFNESADPDIAIVSAAKAAAEGASYPDAAQAAYGDEAAVKNYVEIQARRAINDSGVTVTITKFGYTAPIAGDADNPQSVDGSYTFTVTVAKGQRSQTTARITIAIIATAYNGMTNAQAVAAAKAALVDGSVDVAFGASQADKTAAVQNYVNGLLVGDAAGVTTTVTYNSGTGNYEVTLSKGSANDSKSLTMTLNESADPDIAIVAAAKRAAEGASFGSLTQSAASSESVIAASVKATAEAAVRNGDVAVTINKVSYTAPIAGTSANRSGTDGNYVFTVTVTKGAQSQTTGQIRVSIAATADTSGGNPGGGTPDGSTPGGTAPGGTAPGGNTPGSSTPGGSAPSGGTSGGGTSFADVNKSDWFFDAVAYVQHNGLMSGTSETTFSPLLTADRAMIATVLYRMAGNPHVTGESTFTDVPSGKWYTNAIKWATQSSIASGYSNKRFGIDDAVTREQLVALLYRYAQHKNLNITVSGDLSDFADKDKISDWATESMKWAIGKGIISGNVNGMLDPSGTASRAEIAAILMRFLIGQDPM
ncbi:S-layer homology domain-containing protein [Cohnella herbarum]|uniref:S-layer homology domain-containing protein n=1 Tax=Cohnella herbarum TaxID=2728023 RepID=A0A7Z2ZN54_9BACL|nr:S-layer homology domain-containing protein [Cohnella herbarum]QJD84712.1 S-layer homology domain-containing protein [Cohnella herbarum]